MLSDDQARKLARFANGGDFATDDDFFSALKELNKSEELHYLVQILNWDDYRTKPALEFILDNPNCDAGTALQMYWLTDPEFWKKAEITGDVPTWGQEDYELHRKIERMFLENKFSTAQVAFNPGCYLPSSPDKQSEGERAIPIELKTPSSGQDLGEFYDRYRL
jgi:hypothetical protein